MKIVIFGAGIVGGTLAENLLQNDNDIILIDKDPEVIKYYRKRLDVKTILGSCSNPKVLVSADIKDAYMVLAVTGNDDTNIISCQLVSKLFGIPKKIARIRNNEFIKFPELFEHDCFSIDHIISPTHLITSHISHLIHHPGALQVLEFNDEKIKLLVVRIDIGSLLINRSINNAYELLNDSPMKIIAIFRGEHSLGLKEDVVIESGDEIFLLSTNDNIDKIIHALGKNYSPYNKILIAGGGNIGLCLAKELESKCYIKIIDHNVKRSSYLSSNLNSSVVLLGDASDKDLLYQEDIESIDVFCAVTNDDEVNIMSSIQAKKLGAKHAIALVNRLSYVDLVDGGAIDIAVSPKQITSSSILKYIRLGDVIKSYSLCRGLAEVMEIIVHNEKENSSVVGKSIESFDFPKQIVIGVIIRKNKMIIATPDLKFEPLDHVIIFVEGKDFIHRIEDLFKIKVTSLS